MKSCGVTSLLGHGLTDPADGQHKWIVRCDILHIHHGATGAELLTFAVAFPKDEADENGTGDYLDGDDQPAQGANHETPPVSGRWYRLWLSRVRLPQKSTREG